ncbi:hypothetical protein FG737_24775, partial [Salmonella enterica subsp. enterica serovar London]
PVHASLAGCRCPCQLGPRKLDAGQTHDLADGALDVIRFVAGLVKRFGDDLSKCDFIAAQKLASRGRSAEEIGKAMAEASPA